MAEWYIWLILAILWTLVVIAVGFGAGMAHEKDKATAIAEKLSRNAILTPNEIRREIPPPGPVGAMGSKGDPGPQGPPGPSGMSNEERGRLDALWTEIESIELDNLGTLRERIQLIEGRLTRVERKAGMSV